MFISVASSGIATRLLTMPSLHLNLNHTETPLCIVSKQTDTLHVLRECKLIFWDKATMAHKAKLKVLDTSLQDIRNSK